MQHIRIQVLQLRELQKAIYAYSRACYKFDEINNA